MREEAITEDDSWSCRSMDATPDFQVDTVHCMVIHDSGVTIQHIANTVGIDLGLVSFILSDIFHISARWVQRN